MKDRINIYNAEVRELFNEYYQDSFEPNKKLIAKSIPINYNTFKQWANGAYDLPANNLMKVEMFLAIRGYKAKEKI
ncbi:hypothetical protein JTF04_11565 [Mammaliicoccus vitulinus]|uniref:hypothetical protein n=1 Tax=Mammaliicoccus vitulinus TaxID=71237 RepID=UPI0019526E84|nr:hypothetical protein [Mammaliicoccus vitulinus]MBM6630324.1 hypothetical protein [Mammaliicoccus vitulinus]